MQALAQMQNPSPQDFDAAVSDYVNNVDVSPAVAHRLRARVQQKMQMGGK